MAATRTIEVDEETAERLQTRAGTLGLSVRQLVAEMAALEAVEVPDFTLEELDRQVAAIKAAEPTVAHEDVERWLETWGTPAFKPWRDR